MVTGKVVGEVILKSAAFAPVRVAELRIKSVLPVSEKVITWVKVLLINALPKFNGVLLAIELCAIGCLPKHSNG